jgi:putative methionine-R-sulfoxide reductase with GAF domain
VETRDELEAVRDAGVHFVQGHLVGRPSPEWAMRAALFPAPAPMPQDRRLRELAHQLSLSGDAQSACRVVADHLARNDGLMASVYLSRGDSLRCMAQRGLWQVLDGMAHDAGITGRAWASATPIVVEDVQHHADYLEAIPGVVSEICVPILSGIRAIGALNVESFSRMPDGVVTTLERCAQALSDRLEEIHYIAREQPWHLAAKASVAISGLRSGPGAARQALGCLMQAAGIDSGALILEDEQSPRIVATRGPLATALGELAAEERANLAASVSRIRSCYSAGDPSGRCFLGTDSLRDAGARAVLVLPLWVQHRRIGTVVLAHSKPMGLDGPKVEPLEFLADHVAAVLALNIRPTELFREPPRSTALHLVEDEVAERSIA